MKKAILVVFLMFSAAYTAAQDQNTGPIQQLIDSINKNTKAMEDTQKKIEDQYGFLSEQNRKWSSTIILGTCAFNLGAYFFILLLDSRRKRMQQKRREEYINELEHRIKETELGLIESLKHANDQTTELLKKNLILQEKFEILDDLTKELKPVVHKHSKTSFLAGILAALLVIIALSNMGVL